MNVTYDYYKIFYYVGKYGSFTNAAQMLHSSQPNITRAMNNLEAQLNVKLFTRTKRGVSLTYEGEQLFKKISLAVEQIKMAEEEIALISNYEEGVCTIGVSDIGLYGILVPSLSKIRKRHPKISVKITNESSVSAVKNLKEGLIDFAIVTTPIKYDSELECIVLKSIKECAVASKEFGIDFSHIYTLKELLNYPLIMLSQGTATRTFYDQFFEKNDVELNPQMIAGTVNQVVYMITAGLGIGFVPESILDVGESIEKVKIREEIPDRKICLVFNKKEALKGSVNLLISEILEEAKLI